MVCEHTARGFSSEMLNDTFSLMYFGNSLCAILAGMAAEAAADAVSLTPYSGIWHYGGYCSPFDLSALCLVLGFCLICALWKENYGDSSAAAGCSGASALQQMRASPSIMLAGAIASFSRVPHIRLQLDAALSTSSSASPPFGLIFAAFMVASMGGRRRLRSCRRMRCERILSYVFVCGAISSRSLFFKSTMTLVAFLLFEACAGCTGLP